MIEEYVADLGLGEEGEQCAPRSLGYLEWREHRRELATARGEDIHLPSLGPSSADPGGNWEAAKLWLGFTPDEVRERLDSQR